MLKKTQITRNTLEILNNQKKLHSYHCLVNVNSLSQNYLLLLLLSSFVKAEDSAIDAHLMPQLIFNEKKSKPK